MTNRQVKQSLLIKYGRKCMMCGKKTKKGERTLHHIIPKSEGGETTEDNGAILCANCQKGIQPFKFGDECYTTMVITILKNKKEGGR